MAAIEPRPTWTRFVKLTGAWIAILAVCGVALEGAVRVAGLAPPGPDQYRGFIADAKLPFRLEPRVVLTGTTEEFSYRYEHNERGFRDRARTLEKPPDMFRVVTVGDSFTYGVGATGDETYPAQLESLLTEAFGEAGVDVVNLGTPRYFPEAERVLLEEEGLRYNPDVVVIGFVPNDVADTVLGYRYAFAHEDGTLRSRDSLRIGPVVRTLYQYSHVGRVVLRGHIERSRTEVDWTQIVERDGEYEAAWQRIEDEYAQMGRLVRDAGGIPVFVYVPQPGRSLQGQWRSKDPDYPSERLAKVAQAVGADFVNIEYEVDAALDHDHYYFWPIDGHPNAAGYGVIASAVARAVFRARGLEASGG